MCARVFKTKTFDKKRKRGGRGEKQDVRQKRQATRSVKSLFSKKRPRRSIEWLHAIPWVADVSQNNTLQ